MQVTRCLADTYTCHVTDINNDHSTSETFLQFRGKTWYNSSGKYETLKLIVINDCEVCNDDNSAERYGMCGKSAVHVYQLMSICHPDQTIEYHLRETHK